MSETERLGVACSTCWWWVRHNDMAKTGVCHRYPPTAAQTPTDQYWWCGEWAPLTTEEHSHV